MVSDSDAIDGARRALGAKLAAYRRAAGHNQESLARLTDYSRSTVANVETGRQHVPREFWVHVDGLLDAAGTLIQASDQIEAAVRSEHQAVALRSGPVLTGTAGDRGELTGADGAGDGPLDVIAMAAAQARDHAERSAVTEIGPGTVEQLTAEVARVGRAYVSAPPLPLFAAMHQVLGRVQDSLERRAYPRQSRELNFLAGALCGLMANASLDLGREEAADDLGRAAWTYGHIIGFGPLMGWARGTQALAAIWDHRYLDAVQHAENGLADVKDGMGAVRLHAIRARALAAHGERQQARSAMTAARQARAGARRDELHDGMAGEFAFDDAKLCYYDALTLIDSQDPAAAARAAQTAIRLYRSVPDRSRSYGCEALARVQLAKARLMSGDAGQAAEALAGVLALDPQRRIGSLASQLQACRDLLAVPEFRASGTARQLDRQLIAFAAASAVRVLPGG
jgi:hypothetical protein